MALEIWSVIDSAPKDGSRFLAFTPFREFSMDETKRATEGIGIWWWEMNHRVNRAWFTNTIEQDDYDLENERPTHWMPLPDIP